MAKARLIPKLQLLPSKVDPTRLSLVTTVNFSKVIEIGDPISQAKIYEAQAVDELIFVNLSPYKGEFDLEKEAKVIRRAAEEVFLPLTIGGGVKSVEDFRKLLQNGADKVSINTSAFHDVELISRAADRYGAQCVVVSIDYRLTEDGAGEVYTHGGTQATGKDPLTWAIEAERAGAGELLLTCIDRDGSKKGLELKIAEDICTTVTIPVIISGGCGQAKHFIEGFQIAKADAVSAGTFFSFQDQNPIQTRSHIKNAGIDIRIHT
jgi:cyclase